MSANRCRTAGTPGRTIDAPVSRGPATGRAHLHRRARPALRRLLTPAEVVTLSWADPALAPPLDPAALTPEQQQAMAGNRAALEAYRGGSMADPTLRDRLPAIAVPTLVVWGVADRIAPAAAHAHAYADAIPGARLELVEKAGHLPQLEAPDVLVALVATFSARRPVLDAGRRGRYE